MKTVALIEMGKDGTFGIYTPSIESTIIGEGASVEEAKSDFENSVREVLAMYADNQEELPEELKDISFEYKYDLASFLNYFKFINMTQLAKMAGVNASLMRQYKQGQYVSAKQVSKIQTAINEIGRQMAEVKLI